MENHSFLPLTGHVGYTGRYVCSLMMLAEIHVSDGFMVGYDFASTAFNTLQIASYAIYMLIKWKEG